MLNYNCVLELQNFEVEINGHYYIIFRVLTDIRPNEIAVKTCKFEREY